MSCYYLLDDWIAIGLFGGFGLLRSRLLSGSEVTCHSQFLEWHGCFQMGCEKQLATRGVWSGGLCVCVCVFVTPLQPQRL